jgi:outer membrane protein assembly factor BamB
MNRNSVNEKGHRHLEGAFNWQSLFCEIFETEIDPVALATQSRQPSNLTNLEVMAITLETTPDDIIPIDTGKGGFRLSELSPETRSRLFHERHHYWQFIAAPFHQFRLTIQLERIRAEVARRGGNPNLISGIMPFDLPPIDVAYLEGVADVIDGPFHDFSVTDLLSFFPAQDDKHMVLEVRFRTGEMKQRQRLGPPMSAFGFALGSNPPFTFRYPLSGEHILEGAAYIVEHLHAGKALPRPDITRLAEKLEHRYLGSWHFWCIYNADRYSNEGDLAFAFLAATDLTFVTDLADLRWYKNYKDSGYMIGNCSSRFAFITITARSIPPLSTAHMTPEDAVAEFQRHICVAMGWRTPEAVVQKTAVYLTQLLFQSYRLRHPNEAMTRKVEKWLLTGPISDEDIAERFPRLPEVWKLFDFYGFRAEPLYAQRVLGSMLNACVLRLKHPGRMAIPHLFESWLSTHLPLPVVLLDGEYYPDLDRFAFDEDAQDSSKGKDGDFLLNMRAVVGMGSNAWFFTATAHEDADVPYQIPTLGMLPESVWLTTASSLEYGSDECGFLRETAKKSACFYVSQGLGCPYSSIGLSQSEIEARKKYRIGDWCHWKAHMTKLGLVAPTANLDRELGSELDLSREKVSSTTSEITPTQISTVVITEPNPDMSFAELYPMEGFTARRTRFIPHESILGPTNVHHLTLRWVATTGDRVIESPVVAGYVYIASNDAHLYAFHPDTGEACWIAATGYITSSPVVSNGSVYITTDDNRVHALDARTGQILWSTNTGYRDSSIAFENETLYVSDIGHVYALDPKTGHARWTTTLPRRKEDFWEFTSSPAVADGVVYVTTNKCLLYALDARSGRIMWKFKTRFSLHEPPAVFDNVVFLGGDQLYALSSSKQGVFWWRPRVRANWSVKAHGPPFSPTGYTNPAVAYNKVFAGDNSTLFAFSAQSGKILWSAIFSDHVRAPTIANGVIYFNVTGRRVYALNAQTGETLWTTATDDYIYSSPAIANGTLYFGSDDGKVYAFCIP